MDGDIRPDVLWRNPVTGAKCRLVRERDDGDTGVLPALPDVNWQLSAIADFNGDRQPDLLWRHAV